MSGRDIRRSLGGKTLERDTRRQHVLLRLASQAHRGGGAAPEPAVVDHGELGGLGDDDHSQYVHCTVARTITAQHSFSPAAAQAPFVLGANAQGRKVTGLNADLLDGLSASTNPAGAAVVATDGSGHTTLVRVTLSENLMFGADAGLTRHAANQLGPLAGDAIRSSTYTSGVAGYFISDNLAEFANVRVRGELHAAVFVKDMIDARAGTLMVGKSAGSLAADMAAPGSGTWYMYVKDPPGGGFLFENGDICYIKSEYTGGVAAVWFTVSARADMGDGTQRYTCTYNSGTRGITYPAGAPVTDWGVSGQGIVTISADGTIGAIPNLSIITHAGAPWTTQTLVGRWGNLNGSYGVAGNYQGLGIGDYAGGNYLKYDTNSGFLLKAGDGGVTLDSDGVSILLADHDLFTLPSVVKFVDSNKNVAGALSVDYWLFYKLHTTKLSAESIGDGLHATVEINATSTKVSGSGNVVLSVDSQDAHGAFAIHGSKSSTPKTYVEANVERTYWQGSFALNGGLYVGGTDVDPAAGTIVTAAGGRHIATHPTTWGFLVDMVGTGGWANRGYGFRNGETYLGGFDALGSSASISYFYVGTNYNDSGAVRFYPATGDVRTAGGMYVGSLAGDPAAGWGYFTGGLYVGDTANSKQTLGLTINQGANDDEIIALKSSDVAHGITTWTETDTYGTFKKQSAANGGLQISGLNDAGDSLALALYGWNYSAAATAKSAAGLGIVHVGAGVKDGTGLARAGAQGNLLSIANYDRTEFIFDAEGDLHMDSLAVTHAWDEHDDMALLTGLRAAAVPALRERFGQFIEQARPVLEATGVATFNEDGSVWYGVRALQMLSIDALRQFAMRTEARLECYERELIRLGADPRALLN